MQDIPRQLYFSARRIACGVYRVRGASRRGTGRAINCHVEALGVWASVIESELRLLRRRTLNEGV